MASVEATHDHAHDGVALKNEQSVSKTHHSRTPVTRRKEEKNVGGGDGE